MIVRCWWRDGRLACPAVWWPGGTPGSPLTTNRERLTTNGQRRPIMSYILGPTESNSRRNQDLRPQESRHHAGDRRFSVARGPRATGLVQFEVHQPRQQSGAFIFCRAKRTDFPCFRGVDRRSRTEPAETLCRAAARRGRFKCPHAPGGGQPAAVVSARDCDVLVLVWVDEPLHRQVVLAAGRRSARGYRGHVGSAL